MPRGVRQSVPTSLSVWRLSAELRRRCFYFGRSPLTTPEAMARPNPGTLQGASPTLGLDLNFVF
jgi:hypothetical protein